MPEIILENVTKKFDKFVAVDNLCLHIADRGFVTLLGPSGCGKTTTLRMIAGLETPTSGRILIDGKPVFDSKKGVNVPPNKRDIGFLFQNYALWPHMTVYENIAFGLEMLKWDKAKIRGRVDELLMDEPLSNLDAKLRQEMRAELKRLHSDTNSTFVYVTHDQLEAMTLSTQVCLMNTGLLQQYAPPLTIYNAPANLFVAEFVGNPTMNFIPARVVAADGCAVTLDVLGKRAVFHAQAPVTGLGAEAVLGVRPEFLPLTEDGAIAGHVYSTLPTGMETTLRVACGDAMLTSVVFGSVDYPVDTPVRLSMTGSRLALFDKASGHSVGVGSVEM